MSAEWMNARQTKYSAYTGAYTLVVVAVLVGANYLASQHSKSVDLTANKRYTLSDQSVKIVKNLKDDVQVYYVDESTRFQAARDVMNQYEALNGKFKVQYLDARKNGRQARELGVTTIPTTIMMRGTQRTELRGLSEQEVTSALIRVLKTATKTACFLTGNGERTLEGTGGSDFAAAKEALERNNYKTKSISLLSKPEIDADCSVVVAAGPRQDYPQSVVDALKAHVEKGGHAMFLLDPPYEGSRTRIANNDALAKALGEWGVTLEKNLVLEVGGLSNLGPEWALGTQFGTHAIVKEMKGAATVFPMTRSVAATPGAKATVDELVSTSKSSYATKQLAGKDLTVKPSKEDTHPYPVAVAGSYPTGQAGKDGRFVVTGCSGFASNAALGILANRDLFLNMMDWLSNDEDLISIRPKEPEDRRIQLTASQMMMLRTVSQFLIPALIGLAGLLVWTKRR